MLFMRHAYINNNNNKFCSILNVSLSDSQKLQASLPGKADGLGIHQVSSLVLPAFLASAAGTCVLQSSMLRNVQVNNDAQFESMRQSKLQASLPGKVLV